MLGARLSLRLILKHLFPGILEDGNILSSLVQIH